MVPEIKEPIMSKLRERMRDAMVVRGFALRTQKSYIEALVRLSRYYNHSALERLEADQIEAWLLHMLKERKLSYSTVNQAASACRFLYGQVLKRGEAAIVIPRPKVPQRQPQLLAREEIARLFAASDDIASRTMLMTVYAAGLRVSEVCHLRVSDIDSHLDRMCLRIEQGKGAMDRYTLLSPSLLVVLRQYWRARQPGEWLFSGRDKGSARSIEWAQRAYRGAHSRAGLTKSGGIHTLRYPSTYCYTFRRTFYFQGIARCLGSVAGSWRPRLTASTCAWTADSERSSRQMIHGADSTTCDAGRVRSRISRRITV
jgi:site-specific recombinase XerD